MDGRPTHEVHDVRVRRALGLVLRPVVADSVQEHVLFGVPRIDRLRGRFPGDVVFFDSLVLVDTRWYSSTFSLSVELGRTLGSVYVGGEFAVAVPSQPAHDDCVGSRRVRPVA